MECSEIITSGEVQKLDSHLRRDSHHGNKVEYDAVPPNQKNEGCGLQLREMILVL
jgi:hypothetical protein